MWVMRFSHHTFLYMQDADSLAEITHSVAALWRLVEIRCEWISALHHGDFAQSLWEKGQQFKQEIRHHNPIISVGYHRAAAFFRCVLILHWRNYNGCIQMWSIKLLSLGKVVFSRATIKFSPLVWALCFVSSEQVDHRSTRILGLMVYS